jgi:hypothetical protein
LTCVDEVGLGDLAGVDAAPDADPGEPAGVGQEVANRRRLARIAHRVAQPVDAVALHPPHRAGVVIGPDGLIAVALRRLGQPLGDLVERLVPRNRRESRAADPLLADTAQRHRKALRMVLAVGVAGDLGADDAARIGLPPSTAYPPDADAVDPLDLKRAATRAIVRADAVDDVERQERVPASIGC